MVGRDISEGGCTHLAKGPETGVETARVVDPEVESAGTEAVVEVDFGRQGRAAAAKPALGDDRPLGPKVPPALDLNRGGELEGGCTRRNETKRGKANWGGRGGQGGYAVASSIHPEHSERDR